MTEKNIVPAANQADKAPPPMKIQRGSRQIRYMAQSVLLEESGTSRLVRLAIFLIAGVVVAFVAWSAYTRVDEVAIANGQVVPSGSIQVVQHLEGGIIREILVEEKTLVRSGQPLVRLDPTQAQSELSQVKARRTGLEMRAERLRAFAEGRQPDFGEIPPHFASLAYDQLAIFRQQVKTIEAQQDVLRNQLRQKKSALHTVRQQTKAVRSQLKLLDEELAMRDTLVTQGLTSKVLLLNVKREYSTTQGELARLLGQAATALEEIGEVENRLIDQKSSLRQEVLTELGSVSAELAQVIQSINQLEDRVRRLEVFSPVNGFVQDMKIKTVGAVLPAGGVLMEIVPVDDVLKVEAKISTRDVGHVKVGQPVAVKVTSYDFARYGSVDGILQSISATTFIDEQDGTPYYKGQVELMQPYVGDNAGENPILPGMTVQADVVTGHKTLLEYLLKPIFVSLQQAFHER
ncbi:HlyD family type I secretion periplasmic adaptor subunit [Magnetospira sp. QH-2]|uniref:HlyD family type I secretion periplasmic adaptor subunit n=1 Tax=Magnetospira sp. (strain QH-2) TaxID=1288970 RepID=UPI0003E816E3|nr:HlyD family type I secretion periplasmic adaptor subunit [Magnetospira sp. QH-2]CCQ72674.1 Type I secretion membrane fusion protein, HlyD [Magnetospira sp. QH-2]